MSYRPSASKLMKSLNPGQIQLQGMGWVAAKAASEFKVGEKMMWNFGHTSEVLTIMPKGKSIVFTVRISDGRTFNRIKRADTMIGIG